MNINNNIHIIKYGYNCTITILHYYTITVIIQNCLQHGIIKLQYFTMLLLA